MLQIARRDDVEIAFVLHRNSLVADSMRHLLGGVHNIHLHEPFGHVEMLEAMHDSDVILSDSRGMQEEAPVLVCPCSSCATALSDRKALPVGT